VENNLAKMKAELNHTTRDCFLAFRRGEVEEGIWRRLAVLDAELRNIEALAAYIGAVSPAAARDITQWHAQAATGLEEVKAAGDMTAIERWVKEELAPLLGKAEQGAHLVATARRLGKGKGPKPFAWRV
jgi:hypothetical protein